LVTMSKLLDLLLFVFIMALHLRGVPGHGNMVMPHTWMDVGGKIGAGGGLEGSCTAGWNLPGLGQIFRGSSCYWFTNYTFIPGEPTLEPDMYTYEDYYWFFFENPWRAPGSAPVHSPCGVAGGNPRGCPEGKPQGDAFFDCEGGGYSYGPRAEDYEFKDYKTTEWRAGTEVEAMWSQIANHGGGYSYRLCKLPEEGKSALTEECFQKTPLAFAGDMQWVQYGNDVNNRTEFRANRTTHGTFPEGSQWTKNPIPACSGPDGGSAFNDDSCPQGTQFPPPAPGLFGYGQSHVGNVYTFFDYSVVDKLEVPADLTPGEYVLSFRWDCEQTPQIWSTCASIQIVP